MSQSDILFEKAKQFIPGGVNSPVRAFHGVTGTPRFFAKALGATLTDVDGQNYIDYVGSWGPMILGHQHPSVLAETRRALESAMSFGAPCEAEIKLAELICSLVPSVEKIRMVNSGTEATMTAIRLARGFTQRDKIIKFEGCYHGHNDTLLVKAGSGALTLGQPSSPGIPKSLTQHTINLDFNNKEQLYDAFAKYGDEIAGVIVEPIAGNMGCVPANQSFLEALRALCNAHGSVLIFDEVISGFRVALGGAQSLYNIKPDLTTLGKIIGGGLPVGAVGGKTDIMNHLAPVGPVYQAGTLSGNPIAMSAGLATLQALQTPCFYQDLSAKTEILSSGIQSLAKAHDIPMAINTVTGLFSFFFTDREVINSFEDVMTTNVKQFQAFYHQLLSHGIYLGPSAYECAFISSAHDNDIIEKTLHAFDNSFAKIKS